MGGKVNYIIGSQTFLVCLGKCAGIVPGCGVPMCCCPKKLGIFISSVTEKMEEILLSEDESDLNEDEPDNNSTAPALSQPLEGLPGSAMNRSDPAPRPREIGEGAESPEGAVIEVQKDDFHVKFYQEMMDTNDRRRLSWRPHTRKPAQSYGPGCSH